MSDGMRKSPAVGNGMSADPIDRGGGLRLASLADSTSLVQPPRLHALRQLDLPLVAVRQQLLLVVEQLLMRLRRELHVRAHDNGVHRASLFAVPAVDALGHINIVSRGLPRAIRSLFGFNCN